MTTINQAASAQLLTAPRIGDWGCTFTGRRYWPADPRPGDFDIRDIAHALANQCRFGGHVRRFYSVAEHSVRVSLECEPGDELWGLLHDASEAYLVDVPRPAKCRMPEYKRMEERMMHAICKQFGLPFRMPDSVKRAGEALLSTEARDLMPPESVKDWYLPVPALPHHALVAPMSPEEAEREFLIRFEDLTR